MAGGSQQAYCSLGTLEDQGSLLYLVESDQGVVPEGIGYREGKTSQQGNPYTQELCQLQLTPMRESNLAPLLTEVNTPLKLPVWEKLLAEHPDGAFRGYILEGIQQGFGMGYNYQRHKCHPMASGNLE